MNYKEKYIEYIATPKIETVLTDDKHYYAKEFSKDTLYSYLARTAKRNKPSVGFDTLAQASLDNLLNNTEPMKYKLENGWNVVASNHYIDYENGMIVLPVIASANTITGTRKGTIRDHILELEAIKYVFEANTHRYDFGYALAMYDRTYSPYKLTKTKYLNMIEPEVRGNSEIAKDLVAKTNRLQKFLDKKSSPPSCEDIRWHRRNGVNRPMSCMFYCEYSESCTKKKKPTQKGLKTSIIF